MSVRSWCRAAVHFFGRVHRRNRETEGATLPRKPSASQQLALCDRGQEPGQRVWRCRVKGCDFSMPIAEDQVDSVGFCKVHHLVKHHGLAPAAVIEAEPGLAGEVEAYCEGLGFGWSA